MRLALALTALALTAAPLAAQSATPAPAAAPMTEAQSIQAVVRLAPTFSPRAGGTRVRDERRGQGDSVAVGDLASVHYVGWLTDGRRFDASVGRPPLRLVVGARQVIPGWEAALPGMQPGGVRWIIIPPDQAYGERGAAPAIPPGATLVFRVTLVDRTPAAP